MFPVSFNPLEHRIHEIPCIGFLRRELKDPLLFAFRHGRTGNWMIAAWIDGRRERLLELSMLGKHPVCTSEVVADLKLIQRGNPEGERRKREARAHLFREGERHLHRLAAQQEEEFDLKRFIKSRLNGVRRDAPWFRGIDFKPRQMV